MAKGMCHVAARGRREGVPSDDRFFTFRSLAHVARIQERHWATLRLLRRYGFHPLGDYRLLDVGCGDGRTLRQFVQWGARPERLAGIDLRADAIRHATALAPQMDLRCGPATELPWPDASFDIVCQHTVFTSILDESQREKVAAEMDRVLRGGGVILWYDFMYNNPSNPNVRGVKKKELRALFPGFALHLRRITLAPPLARWLPGAILPVLYPLLNATLLLRTHYLGLLIKRAIHRL